MPRSTRMTRTESKERTRRLLLDAARPLFLEHGFYSCSLEQIAEQAGFSTGAVYSNFGGKTELATHVLDELYLQETENVARMLALSEQSSSDAAGLLEEWVRQTIGDPDWARFELELTTAMAANENLLSSVARRYTAMRGIIAALANTQKGGAPEGPEVDWDSVSTLLLGVVLGVAIQRVVDRGHPTTPLPHALRAIIRQPPML